MLLRPNEDSKINISLECKEKGYKENTFMDSSDGWVCFHNSELICGQLGNKDPKISLCVLFCSVPFLSARPDSSQIVGLIRQGDAR